MKIVNVCATEADREIADTGQVVRFGEEVDIDDRELAGRPPSGEPDDEKYDPGSGLLAQAGVWNPPTTDAAKAAKKIRAERDAAAAKEAAAATTDTAAPAAEEG